MKHGISRRDFLKLAGVLPLGLVVPPAFQKISVPQNDPGRKNVLIVVFDALSAYNVSLHGYSRKTTPNLERLAKRSTVYHNHFAGGNYTTPGTASLLTGTLPWTHRAFQLNRSVAEHYLDKSIFHAFDDYHRFAYSHNPFVNSLLDQFMGGIDDYIPQEKLFLVNDGFIRELFGGDEDTAAVGWTRFIKRMEDESSYSLFLPQWYERFRSKKVSDIAGLFPYGLPNVNQDNYFTLEQGIDWLGGQLAAQPNPFLGYFHFLPPHHPYKPSREFAGQFSGDGWKPPVKPTDLFNEDKTEDFLKKHRAFYDEFVLYVDHEFGRLMDWMESTGVLDDTWVVFTSDHGEMFERGIFAHSTPTLYQPVIRVPLMVFEPGRQTGRDVHAPTSAIDLLPTLLHVTVHNIPDWVEGTVLPPYAPGLLRTDPAVYAVQARYNNPHGPLTEATLMMAVENYKLIYYAGYEELGGNRERIQVFDLQADPEELNDLSSSQPDITADLMEKMRAKKQQVDEPYQ